jgi:hypothetical protein
MVHGSGFRVYGLAFRVYGLAFRVYGLAFRVYGLAFRVYGLAFRVYGLAFRVYGLAFRVYGLAFRVYGLAFRVYGSGFKGQERGFLSFGDVCKEPKMKSRSRKPGPHSQNPTFGFSPAVENSPYGLSPPAMPLEHLAKVPQGLHVRSVLLWIWGLASDSFLRGLVSRQFRIVSLCRIHDLTVSSNAARASR